jgi:hypothetical protein
LVTRAAWHGDAFGAKPFLPAPDDGLGLSGSPHDLGGAVAVGGQQDDLGPPDMLLRTVPIGDNRLQLGSVGGAQFDLDSFALTGSPGAPGAFFIHAANS